MNTLFPTDSKTKKLYKSIQWKIQYVIFPRKTIIFICEQWEIWLWDNKTSSPENHRKIFEAEQFNLKARTFKHESNQLFIRIFLFSENARVQNSAFDYIYKSFQLTALVSLIFIHFCLVSHSHNENQKFSLNPLGKPPFLLKHSRFGAYPTLIQAF